MSDVTASKYRKHTHFEMTSTSNELGIIQKKARHE